MTIQSAVPSVRGAPLLGNLQDFRKRRLDLMLRVARECGDIGLMRIGGRRLYLVNAPAYIHYILVERGYDFEKTPLLRKATAPVLGNGLLTSENEFHKRQRKLVAPAFQHRRIANYATVMADYAERMQAEWRDGVELDINREMMRLTLWIVGKTLFDADVLGEAEELGAALKIALRYANQQIVSPLQIPLSWPLPRNRRTRMAIKRLDTTILRMVAERRAGGEDRGDLVSMLLQARDEDDGTFMTDQQVRDEAMTLFLAGHETTANALAWSWLLLGQHPEIYARMRAEVDDALGGRPPAFEDLKRLPYTLQVLKEALRLYPPAYTFGRQAKQPFTLGQHHFPAGTLVLMSPYTMHRRPDFYPDPQRFDPQRFTPEAEARLPRHTYIPFGGGPRICIGNHFALMEAQIILATLVQRVTFDLIPGQQIIPEPMITLRPKYGIRVHVRRR